jgi:hypothetical protein
MYIWALACSHAAHADSGRAHSPHGTARFAPDRVKTPHGLLADPTEVVPV